MISEKYFKDNFVVSLVKLHSKKTKMPVFAVASAITVNVRWEDNTVEQIDLLERLPIPMSALERMKFMVGKVVTPQEAEKHISSDILKELMFKHYSAIKEREEMGYFPDRLTGDKKPFKKIYEIKKRKGGV